MAIHPIFLTTEDVIDIHRDQIDRYGGTQGIRDPGLLDSAVHVPQGTMGGEYLLPDLFEMAGAMMYSLIQNHAFVDGNKRSRRCGGAGLPLHQRRGDSAG
jgi:death-on-curing protein